MNLTLSASDLDILKEVGNISVGKTLTALRMIIDKNLDVSFPNVEIIDSDKIYGYFTGTHLMVGLHFHISEDINGMMLYLFKKEDANLLIDVLKNTKLGSTVVLNEIEVNTIKEIANIMAGAYLHAMAEMSKLTMIQSLPHFVFDTGPCIFDFLKGASYEAPHQIFLLKSELAIANVDYKINGHLIISLPPAEMDKLLSALRKRES